MKPAILTLSCILIFTSFIAAQKRPMGLLIDPAADQAYMEVPTLPKYEGAKFNDVPQKLSLREFCPVPGDQGTVGSCVGWACGYAGLTIMKAVQKGMTDRSNITTLAHSASFIYNQIKVPDSDCVGGARITDALWLLLDQGDCLVHSFPNSNEDCSALPGDDHFMEAANFKLKDFAAVFSLEDEPEVKINKTIKMVATKNPVVVGMEMTPSFWDVTKENKYWMPQQDEPSMGGHAMVVVGYDYARKAFELMNSYGPNWGDDGFLWLRFEDFGKLVKYAFYMVPEDNFPASVPSIVPVLKNEKKQSDSNGKNEKKNTATPPAPLPKPGVDMKGQFNFRRVDFIIDASGKEMLNVKEAPVKLMDKNGTYLLEGQWKINDLFQLMAKEVPKGQYIYALSIDEKGLPKLLFPDQNQSGLIPGEDAEIIIPGLDEGLVIDRKEDNLCVLYCQHKIKDLDLALQSIGHAKGSIQEKVKMAFGEQLVSPPQIKYAQNQMAFTAQTLEVSTFIVPVYLLVTVK